MGSVAGQGTGDSFYERAKTIIEPVEKLGPNTMSASLRLMAASGDMNRARSAYNEGDERVALAVLEVFRDHLAAVAEANGGEVTLKQWHEARSWFCPRPPWC